MGDIVADEPVDGGTILATVAARASERAGQPDPDRGGTAAQDAEERLMRAWWLDERPPWTEQSWWEADLREDVRRMLWLPAGPLLASALAEVPVGAPCTRVHEESTHPGMPRPGRTAGWPCACQVVVAAAWEACAAWAAARSALALVDAAGREPFILDVAHAGRQIVDPAREELAHALRSSPTAMQNRIAAARSLAQHDRLVELVATAALSGWAARLVMQEIADLSAEDAAQVVAAVCDQVLRRLACGRRPWTSAEVRRAARLARLRTCPDSDRSARERAFTLRAVRIFPSAHGMATLVADLAESDAHRIHRRLSSIARALARDLAGAGDDRGRDQLRADVLVDLVLRGVPRRTAVPADPIPVRDEDPSTPGGLAPSSSSSLLPQPPRPGGSAVLRDSLASQGPRPCPMSCHRNQPARADDVTARAEIHVVVPLTTLLGLTADPASIRGLGPVPAEIARELAADGRWRAWVSDAAGSIMSTGSLGYVPSAGLARAVRAREPHCRMPGCRQPAESCDLDHAVPYPVGATTPDNLGPLCRRHHVMKTHGSWRLEPLGRDSSAGPGGPHWRWRSPAGLTVVDYPNGALE